MVLKLAAVEERLVLVHRTPFDRTQDVLHWKRYLTRDCLMEIDESVYFSPVL